MKKTISAALAVILTALFVTAGFSAPVEKVAGNTGLESGKKQTQSAPAVETEKQSPVLFGKVKNIIGNEIELELAEPPFEELSGEDGASGAGQVQFAADAAGTSTFAVAVSEDAATAQEGGGEPVTAIAVTGDDGKTAIIGGEGKEGGMELEYTGETQQFILPAGAEILSILGAEADMDIIKKGSVLMVTLDAEDESIATSVFVLE